MNRQYSTKSGKNFLFIADAHLPLDDRKGARQEIIQFRQMLVDEGSKADCIVLLGDVFDFWYEWDYVIPKHAFKLLNDIRNLVNKGTEIHYFAGNHDFRIEGFLGEELGVILHQDEWIANIDGKKCFIHHGDGYAASDIGYRRLKKVMRNKIAQFLFKFIVHPDFALSLGKWTSNLGRTKYKKYSDGRPPDSEYIDSAKKILDSGYDMVIFGHTHRNKYVDLNTGFYLNPGPWMHYHMYCVFEDGVPVFKSWKQDRK